MAAVLTGLVAVLCVARMLRTTEETLAATQEIGRNQMRPWLTAPLPEARLEEAVPPDVAQMLVSAGLRARNFGQVPAIDMTGSVDHRKRPGEREFGYPRPSGFGAVIPPGEEAFFLVMPVPLFREEHRGAAFRGALNTQHKSPTRTRCKTACLFRSARCTGRGDARLRRLANLPRADWGKAVAHAGLGVTFIGIAAMTAWQTEDIRVAQVGDRFEVAGYGIQLDGVEEVQGPNYYSTMATMSVWDGERRLATLHPEKRVYPVAQMPTTEAAIDNGIWRDFYLVIGDPQAAGGYAVRTYVKPFANWIWAGAIIMSLGGCLSLTDRRFRVAAGEAKSWARPVPAE